MDLIRVLDYGRDYRFSEAPHGPGSFSLEQEEEWEVMPVRCPLPAHKIIFGFTQYHSSVPSLPASQQAQIREVASLILRSFQPGCQPMMGVLLIGHADRDVRRGPSFEHEISVKRAVAVRDALRQAIGIQGRGVHIPRGFPAPSAIDWRHKGVGATQLIVPNPVTGVQRARNRRVEILLALRSYPSLRPEHAPAAQHSA